MQQVRLKQYTRAKLATETFLGYEHTPEVRDGAWFEANNLSNDLYPRFSVRRARRQLGSLGGLSMDGVIALAGNDRLVALYQDGRIGCNGNYQPILQTFDIIKSASEHGTVTVTRTDFLDEFGGEYGRYRYTFDRTNEYWDVDVWVPGTDGGRPVTAPTNGERIATPACGLVRNDARGEERIATSPSAPRNDTRDGAWVPARSPVADLSDFGIATSWQPDDQDDFYIDYRAEVANMRRTMVETGAFVCIWPDKVWCNVVKLAAGTLVSDDFGSIEADWLTDFGPPGSPGKQVTFTLCDRDGKAFTPMEVGSQAPQVSGSTQYWVDTTNEQPFVSYWSEGLNGWFPVPNCYVKIEMDDILQGGGFAAGDGVDISFWPPRTWRMSGGSSEPDPLQPTYDSVWALLGGNKILQGVPSASEDSIVLPGFFLPPDGQSGSWTVTITGDASEPYLEIKRTVPAMQYVVECGNRLWGCMYGGGINEIYASKLGDFKNWNVFQGVSTDSYAASRGAAGPFTGAAVLDGHPLFFRENSVEKVFPSASGAHQIQTQTLDGIQEGSDRSAVVIDEKLYYKGVGGVYVYSGTLPRLISGALGDIAYTGAEAARHGKKYLISMEAVGDVASAARRYGDVRRLFVYDTQTGLWQPEEDANGDAEGELTGLQRLATYQNKAYLFEWDSGSDDPDAKLWAVDGSVGCRGVRWYAETGILGLGVSQKKYISRIHLRYKLELGAAARVYIQYDESGRWHLKESLAGTKLHSGVLTIWTRRCDTFRLRLEGVGNLEVYDITYERERGSDT